MLLSSCPPPDGFDLPELADHKVVYVEKLSDSDLAAQAKSAKAKAKHEMGYSDMVGDIEKTIISTIERFGLKGIDLRATGDGEKQEAKPAPKVQAEPKPKLPPKEKKADKPRVKRVKNWISSHEASLGTT